MTDYAAIIPLLIVALAGAAAMLAEAFRQPGERMPIAGLGLIGPNLRPLDFQSSALTVLS